MFFQCLWRVFSFLFCNQTSISRQAREEKEAVFLDCDMSSKFRELLDDPFMNTEKWKEWLPIFEFADIEVRRKCNLNLGRNADFVRSIISNRDLTGP